MKHRPYQTEALEASKDAFERGVNRQLIQLFTGGGKTVIFASIPTHFSFSKRVLFIVHTEELAQQAADKLRIWNPGARIGIEMANSYAHHTDTFVVGSVATLGRSGGSRLSAFNPDDFSCVVIDE